MPISLSYSPTENVVLICSDIDGGSYELYVVPKDSLGRSDTMQEAKKGLGEFVVFIVCNRFDVLDKNHNQVTTNNLGNEVIKNFNLPVIADALFFAWTCNLLCRLEDSVVLFYM